MDHSDNGRVKCDGSSPNMHHFGCCSDCQECSIIDNLEAKILPNSQFNPKIFLLIDFLMILVMLFMFIVAYLYLSQQKTSILDKIFGNGFTSGINLIKFIAIEGFCIVICISSSMAKHFFRKI